MSWNRIDEVAPPVDRPVMIRTAEGGAPRVAFLSADGVWHEGGALVQTASTLLAATSTEWCEPEGDNAL